MDAKSIKTMLKNAKNIVFCLTSLGIVFKEGPLLVLTW